MRSKPSSSSTPLWAVLLVVLLLMVQSSAAPLVPRAKHQGAALMPRGPELTRRQGSEPAAAAGSLPWSSVGKLVSRARAELARRAPQWGNFDNVCPWCYGSRGAWSDKCNQPHMYNVAVQRDLGLHARLDIAADVDVHLKTREMDPKLSGQPHNCDGGGRNVE